jgi:hypothetical protein
MDTFRAIATFRGRVPAVSIAHDELPTADHDARELAGEVSGQDVAFARHDPCAGLRHNPARTYGEKATGRAARELQRQRIMRLHLRGTVSAVLVVATLAACGGATGSGGSSGRGTSSGTEGECALLYQALSGAQCGGLMRPTTEDARVQKRFEQACQNAVALPGSGLTAQVLSDCISAAQSPWCDIDTSTVLGCSAPGSLPGGSPCSASVQCQSGTCLAGVFPIGSSGTPPCGTCTPVIANGQPCGRGETCGPGSACTYPLTCVAIASGTEGAHCDANAALCNPGLYCNASGMCTPFGSQGEPCVTNTTDTNTVCAPSLRCVPGSQDRTSGTCRSRSAAGGPCQQDDDCAAGFSCDANSTCIPWVWVGPGQPCDAAPAVCLVGGCTTAGPTGTPTTCPTVIPDGQACDPSDRSSTCDVLSSCVNGRCTLANSFACQ